MVAQVVKHPPTVEERQVQSLGWKDPLEKEMATHSSILAWVQMVTAAMKLKDAYSLEGKL